MMLGAGMVIIQPETRKIVCVYERAKNYWFLPKVCGQALTWSIAMADFTCVGEERCRANIGRDCA